jgi:hypothetical protein
VSGIKRTVMTSHTKADVLGTLQGYSHALNRKNWFQRLVPKKDASVLRWLTLKKS